MLSFLLGEGGQRTVRFTDAAGSQVSLSLAGPGSGVATLEGDAADLADLARLELMGTTDTSRLTISITKKGAAGGLIDIPEGGLGALKVNGTLAAAVLSQGLLKQLSATAISDATVAAPTIGQIKIKGDIVGSTILAGLDPVDGILGNGNDVLGPGTIGLVQARRLLGSSIAAGVAPGADGLFGTPDDIPEQDAGISSIGQVKVKKEIRGDGTGVRKFGIAAADASPDVRVGRSHFTGSAEFGVVGPIQSDTLPPTAPTSLDLLPSSDTGQSDSDNITNVVSPTFQVVAEQGSLVRLFVDGTQRAQGIAAGPVQLTVGPLADGVNQFTATATDAAGNVSDPSAALSVTIDTIAPDVPVFDLDPAFDSDPAGDMETTFAIVTLIGQTAPDKTLDLVGTGATTMSDGTGRFEFTGVSLALGANTFTVRARDVAGNQSNFTKTITRDEQGGEVLLEEQDNFVIEATISVPLDQTAGTRKLRFDLDPQFDATDQSATVEDLFLVYLVDPLDPTRTLIFRDEPGTALFSLAGNVSEFTPGQVRYDGSSVEIDVTSLTGQTSGLLVFQLINSDGDTGTTVQISGLSNTVDPQGVAGPLFPISDVEVAPESALDLMGLNPSADVELLVSNVRFDSTSGRYTTDLRLRNDGAAIGRQVAAVFTGLPAEVELVNRSGVDSSGEPYVNFANAIPAGGLAQGATSEPVEVVFSNPGLTRFALLPQVLVGGPNRAPQLDPVGPLSVRPGERLEVPLVARDPDGDRVLFSLRADAQLPTGMLQADGTLVFTPMPAEVGTYQFTVAASDGALETTQPVSLTVVADPVTSTRISGVIQDTNLHPLVGLPVEIGGTQTMTAADGTFLLDFGTGPLPSEALKVRGEQLGGPVVYPLVAANLPAVLGHAVFGGVNNVIAQPINLQPIDVANAVTIDPAVDTTVTTPTIPGASLTVAAGNLRDAEGNLFSGQLGITAVMPNLPPVPLPTELHPDLAVLFHPEGLVFTNPAPLTLPNRAGWAPDVVMDLWCLDPDSGLFEDAGNGRVNVDGSVVQTIVEGISTTSLCFFVPQPNTPDDVSQDVFNRSTGGNEFVQTVPFTSDVELHSGAVLETHDLVTYKSLGQTRGLTLQYDSLRADPRPIVHFGYPDVDPAALAGPNADQLRMVARLTIERDNFTLQVPGLNPPQFGLPGGEHFWSIPNQVGPIDAALQADLSAQPSGQYDFDVGLGLLLFDPAGASFVGSSRSEAGKLLHVNSIDSPFGSGWGLAGLQEIVENPDGSALVIDGDGSELLFGAPPAPGTAYVSPPGDFSTLEKFDDGTGTLVFRRTLTDQTVYLFKPPFPLPQGGATGALLASVTDRNGNQTQHVYDNLGRLTTIIDPAGLPTQFNYSGRRVTKIIDPVPRVTNLVYDAAGDLIRIIDPDGSERTFDYDAGHHMTAEIDRRGFREQTFYGFHGRAIRGVRADGSVVQVSPLDTQGLRKPLHTTDPFSAPPATPLLDAQAPQADPNGNVTETMLDQQGQTISQRDAIGCLLAGLQRNDRNLPRLIQDCLGNEFSLSFDSNGNPTSLRDLFSGVGGPLDFHISIFPFPVALGDFDGDGILDLAAEYFPAFGDSRFSVFVGNGDGTFSLGFDPDGFFSSNSITTADLNGDGLLDIILDGEGGLFLNNGNGGFTQTNVDAAMRTLSVAVGDLNGDDNLDLVFGGSTSFSAVPEPGQGAIDVYFGDGQGAFGSPPPDPGHGTGTGSCDDDDDGDPGTARTFTRYCVPQREPQVVLGDVDGDGDQDAIIGFSHPFLLFGSPDRSTTLSLLLNDGTGGFGEPIDLAVPDFAQRVLAGDLDGDGRLDVVVLSGNLTVSVFRGITGGTFGPREDFPMPTAGVKVGALGDINGDGHIDIVAGSRSLLNDGAGGFTLGPVRDTGASAVGDLDGDGDLDFADGDGFGFMRIRLNDGTGAGTSTGLNRRRFTYDRAFNQLTSFKDELGRETLYQVDPANGNRLALQRSVKRIDGTTEYVITQFTYTPQGLVDTTIDPLGRVTDNDYDPFGRPIVTTLARGIPDEAVNKFKYDMAGNQIELIDEHGHRTEWKYDALNRRTLIRDALGNETHFKYDAAGNLIELKDARGNVTSSEYDALNRLIRTTGPDPDGPAGPLPAPVSARTYDLAGNLASIIDPVGHETRNFYDARNRLVKTTDADGGATQYEYDLGGDRTAIIDPAGNRTEFLYDGRNRVVRETDPLGRSIVWEYDPADNQTAKTDRNGRCTELTYDELDRLVTEKWFRADCSSSNPADVVNLIQSTYDTAGNLLSVGDNFSSLAYTYDGRNRIVTVDNAGTPAAPRVVLTYTYDEAGNIVTVTDMINGQPGGTNAYRYDELDRMTQVTQTGAGVTDKRVDFSYNDLGQFAAIERFGDLLGTQLVVRSVYTYDELNRLIHLTHSNNTDQVAFYRYAYDAAGRISQMIDRDGTEPITISGSLNQSTSTTIGGDFGASQVGRGAEHILDLGTAQIPVETYSWAESVAVPGAAPQPLEFTITAPASEASPGLAVAAAARTHFPQFVLTSRTSDGREYVRWTFKDATITAFKTTDVANDGTGPLDTIGLRFGEVEQRFSTFAPDGTLLRTRTASYDFTKDQVMSGTAELLGDAVGTPEHSLEVDGGGLIEILAIDWSEAMPATSGSAELGDVRVTSDASGVSPGLLLAVATGERYGRMELVSRQLVAGELHEFQRWMLEGVTVTSYTSDTTPPAFDGPVRQTVSLHFDRITLTHTRLAPDGTVLGTTTSSWDRLANGGTGGEFGTELAGPRAEHVLDLGTAEVAVSGFSWVEETPAGTSVVVPGAFTVTAAGTAASPGLAVAVAAGTRFPQFILTSRTATGQEYARWVLKDAAVRSFRTAETAGDSAGPVDTFTLQFTEIEQQFTTLAPDGTPLATRTSGYNFVQARVTSGTAELSGDAASTAEHSLEVDGGGMIEILAIDWSEAVPAAGGRAELGDVRVTADATILSPGLLLAVATGERYARMELVSRQVVAGELREFQRWTLEGVTVTSYQSDASPPAFDGPARQTLSLHFDKITFTHTRLAPDGTELGTTTSSWERMTNAVTGGDLGTEQVATGAEHVLDLGTTQIQISAFTWGEDREESPLGGSGVRPRAFTVSAPATAASPGLAIAVPAGTVFPQLVLTTRAAGVPGPEYSRWVLRDVIVGSFATSDTAGDSTGPADTFTLRFREVEQRFSTVAPDGTVLDTRTAGYDFAQNVVTIGTADLSGNATGTPEHSLEVDGGGLIEILAIEWSEAVPAAGGQAELGDLRLTVDMSRVSSGLLLATATGQRYGKAALVSRELDAGGQLREFARWTLNGVTVTSYDSSARIPEFDGPAKDTITLHFDEITLTRTLREVGGVTTYTYDDTDQLAGATRSNPGLPDESFTYDMNGNRTGPGIVIGPGNRLVSDGTFHYEYDAEGNLVRRTELISGQPTGPVREFEYDHRNRLVQLTDKSSLSGMPTQIVRFVYDSLDRRIAKSADTTPQDAVDAAVTHFVYDRDDVLLEFLDPDGSGPQPSALSSRLLHGPVVDQVLAQENLLESNPAQRVLWLLPDHLGTIRDLVDSTGTVRNHITYDAFGRVIRQTDPSVKTRYLFTGREFDAETGLYYYRARYYDPATGRFVSEDPLRFRATDANLYRYVANDPVAFVDPTGTLLQPGEIPPPSNLGVGQTATLIRVYKESRESVTGNALLDALFYIFGFFHDRICAEYLVTRTTTTSDGMGGYATITTTVVEPRCDDVASSVEWVFLAGLGILAAGRLVQERRRRRRQGRSGSDREADGPHAVDSVLEELA